MENYKTCSLKQHKETKARSYCQQCDIYMCEKCAKIHSELCQNHIPYNLDSDKTIFTGICQRENHSEKLIYFCRTHNELCCSSCITKIKGNGNGQHTDCSICFIGDIKDEKKNKLKENINNLEKISNTFEESLKNLKSLYEKINANKEELKKSILIIFTKIRNEINEREDKILSEVDQKFDELYFKEELIKKGEKLPKKVKESIQQGKLIDKDWNENKKKLNSIINDCIAIENDLKDINNINFCIKKFNSIYYDFKFTPLEKDKKLSQFIYDIKQFGSLYYKEYKLKEKEEEVYKEEQKQEKEISKEEEKYYEKIEEKNEEAQKDDYYYYENVKKEEEPKKEYDYYYENVKKEEPKKQYNKKKIKYEKKR